MTDRKSTYEPTGIPEDVVQIVFIPFKPSSELVVDTDGGGHSFH